MKCERESITSYRNILRTHNLINNRHFAENCTLKYIDQPKYIIYRIIIKRKTFLFILWKQNKNIKNK